MLCGRTQHDTETGREHVRERGPARAVVGQRRLQYGFAGSCPPAQHQSRYGDELGDDQLDREHRDLDAGHGQGKYMLGAGELDLLLLFRVLIRTPPQMAGRTRKRRERREIQIEIVTAAAAAGCGSAARTGPGPESSSNSAASRNKPQQYRLRTRAQIDAGRGASDVVTVISRPDAVKDDSDLACSTSVERQAANLRRARTESRCRTRHRNDNAVGRDRRSD